MFRRSLAWLWLELLLLLLLGRWLLPGQAFLLGNPLLLLWLSVSSLVCCRRLQRLLLLLSLPFLFFSKPLCCQPLLPLVTLIITAIPTQLTHVTHTTVSCRLR